MRGKGEKGGEGLWGAIGGRKPLHHNTLEIIRENPFPLDPALPPSGDVALNPWHQKLCVNCGLSNTNCPMGSTKGAEMQRPIMFIMFGSPRGGGVIIIQPPPPGVGERVT